MNGKLNHRGYGNKTDFEFDVVVAGGGPAGSTAAGLLAQNGHRVLLIERGSHPRFHIGESMLPRSEPVMQRLGVDWGRGNLFKGGAEFIDERVGKQIYFPLSGRYKTYQIERSRFDKLLFENAAEKGAKTHQQEAVKDVECHENSVCVRTNKAEYRSRYFIDATGRSAIMGRKLNGIKRIEGLGTYSLYTHYRGVNSEQAAKLFESGNVQILSIDIGWIWLIPLVNRRLSVGLVVQRQAQSAPRGAELLNHYLAQSPYLSKLIQGAEQEDSVHSEADFSFINRHRYGLRYACCGDASGFLDPVFSSGVFFAVSGAERLADRLHDALLEQREDDPELYASDDEIYQLGFRTMRIVVERFYQSDLIRGLFFEVDRDPVLKKDIAAILAGDLWSGGRNRFQERLLMQRRGKTRGQEQVASLSGS